MFQAMKRGKSTERRGEVGVVKATRRVVVRRWVRRRVSGCERRVVMVMIGFFLGGGAGGGKGGKRKCGEKMMDVPGLCVSA